MEGECGRSMWQATRCVTLRCCCSPGLVSGLAPHPTKMMGWPVLAWLYSWCACRCAQPRSISLFRTTPAGVLGGAQVQPRPAHPCGAAGSRP